MSFLKNFLIGFLGGIVSISLVLFIFGYLVAESHFATINFGDSSISPESVSLLDSGYKNGKVYIKYKNVSEFKVSSISLNVKIFLNDELKFEESTYHFFYIKPGEETEGLVDLEEQTLEVINENIKLYQFVISVTGVDRAAGN